MAYAEGTTVSIEKSKGELKKVIYTHGGSNYEALERDTMAGIQFHLSDRMLRFIVQFPAPDAMQFKRTPTGRSRSSDVAYKEWEGECRRRWRALVLSVKAKFETVESGIETFEQAFLANTVLPDGRTVAEHTIPMVARAYETGEVPKTILALPEVT